MKLQIMEREGCLSRPLFGPNEESIGRPNNCPLYQMTRSTLAFLNSPSNPAKEKTVVRKRSVKNPNTSSVARRKARVVKGSGKKY